MGYGLYATSFFGIRNSNLSFGIFGLLGIFFSTLLSYFTHLFFAHNIYHNLLFHLVGLILFYFFYSKNYILYKTEIKKLFLLIVFFISCLFLSKNNEDFPYYHLPYTLNLVEHKIQFGISHFNIAFRTPSSLFYLQSLFYLPYIKYYMFHSSSLLILIFCHWRISNFIFTISSTSLAYLIFFFNYYFVNFCILNCKLVFPIIFVFNKNEVTYGLFVVTALVSFLRFNIMLY